MDPLRDDLLRLMERVQPRRAAIPMYSTVNGEIIDGSELAAQYWVNNLRKPVLFLAAIQALLEDDYGVFMEMSPHPILVGAVRQTIEQSEKSGLALSSMRRDEEGRAAMLATLGTLYTQGCPLNWSALYITRGHHVPLPTRPIHIFPVTLGAATGRPIPSLAEACSQRYIPIRISGPPTLTRRSSPT